MKFKLWLEFNEVLNPELFDKLKEIDNELAGVHFSDGFKIDANRAVSQLGLNINPFHHDPIGIYAFPKNYVLSGGLKSNTGFASKKFAFIIIPSPSARILNLNMSLEKAGDLLDRMGIGKEILNNPEVYHKSRKSDPGHMFWGALEYHRTKNELSKNMSWNTLFAKTGYNVLYDPGLSIIHSNEPSQIIYLDNKSYTVVDVISENKKSILMQFAAYFPDYRMMKRKGYSYSKEQILSLKKDSMSIELVAGENPGYLHVKVYGFKEPKEIYKRVESKEDLLKIVEEVKQFLNTAEKQDFSSENDEEKYKIMFDIARLYNLKIEKEHPGNISRLYKSKQSFSLLYSSYSNEITLEIKKGGWSNYLFYHQETPTNAEDTIKNLLNGLKNRIKEEKESGGHYRWEADSAMDFVNFLEKRVFIKRS